MLPFALERTLLGLLQLGAAVWIGGFVAITVVSASSKQSIAPSERIALFRGIGRRFLLVAVVAAAVVVVTGGVLLAFRPFDVYSCAIVAVAVALVIVTAFGVRQARQLGRMRKAAARETPAPEHSAALARKAGAARVLRTLIGLLSLALFIIAVAMP